VAEKEPGKNPSFDSAPIGGRRTPGGGEDARPQGVRPAGVTER